MGEEIGFALIFENYLELRNTGKLSFSRLSVIPAQAGIQIKPMRVWIPFFKGMTEKRVS
mgnify:CR=1 FL=1